VLPTAVPPQFVEVYELRHCTRLLSTLETTDPACRRRGVDSRLSGKEREANAYVGLGRNMPRGLHDKWVMHRRTLFTGFEAVRVTSGPSLRHDES
jgi:hypothetical protein